MNEGRNEMIDRFKLLLLAYRDAWPDIQEREVERKLTERVTGLVDELIASRAEVERLKAIVAKPRDTATQEETLKIMREMKERAPSLRDAFAAEALSGLLACPGTRGTYDEFVNDAWIYADKMIAARNASKGGAV